MFYQEKNKQLFTVAFYNVENLFDPRKDPKTLDSDFTAEGKYEWNFNRYKKKITKIGRVLSTIGNDTSAYSPVLIGLAEIENESVVRDLINSSALSKEHYDYVHFDSPDERGIDVSLLYKKEHFEYIASEALLLYVENERGVRDYTRDILKVEGRLNGEHTFLFVNHWPSRRDGHDLTKSKRIKAASVVQEEMAKISKTNKEAKFIIMGDFNDNPVDDSIKNHLVKNKLFNPMLPLYNRGMGSTIFNRKWDLFDQIILSDSYTKNKSNHSFHKAAVYNKEFLKIYKGKRKGSPFRTFIGKWYQGGYSDHFPVYIQLKRN